MKQTKQVELPQFGDKIQIEMKRYGVDNELFTHKVVNTLRSNTWVDVPVQSPATEVMHDHMEDVVSAICEGVSETEVLKYRVEDVKIIHSVAQAQQEAVEITGETSDGYHTFNELYEFRKLYNATLFNEWANQGKYNVHKSTRHHDGEACFGGGWFIVMATLPTGQISNHYEIKDWYLFKCEEREEAEEWDGHTAQDVLKRLEALQKEQE